MIMEKSPARMSARFMSVKMPRHPEPSTIWYGAWVSAAAGQYVVVKVVRDLMR